MCHRRPRPLSSGKPFPSDTLTRTPREVNSPLRFCAKQISHFVDARIRSVRKVLIHEGFHRTIPRTAGRRPAPWIAAALCEQPDSGAPRSVLRSHQLRVVDSPGPSRPSFRSASHLGWIDGTKRYANRAVTHLLPSTAACGRVTELLRNLGHTQAGLGFEAARESRDLLSDIFTFLNSDSFAFCYFPQTPSTPVPRAARR